MNLKIIQKLFRGNSGRKYVEWKRLILKMKCAMDNMAIVEKEAKPIHAEGTCTYIILTLSPCK